MTEDIRNESPTTALVAQASPEVMAANMQRMSAMIELKRKFLQENLKEGIEKDYAVIPGTKKLSLLKPGAEKLLDWHGLYPSVQLMSEKEDWDIGLFAYTYRCTIKQKGSNLPVAECDGDASSYESKYRFEWKYASELPAGIDHNSLPKKGTGNNIKYQVIVANPADKRNTVRKMAQKRALIGATVLATATSDLFAADVDPEGEGDGTEGQSGNGSSQGASGSSGPKDYGKPISEAQCRRFFGLMKGTTITKDQLLAYIKAKYGFESLEAVGWKAYDDICKAIESGHLEMAKPAAAAPAETQPSAPAASTPATGPKASVAQIKDMSMMLAELGQTESQFKEWLAEAYPQYAGRGINDLLSADVDGIKAQFRAWVKGEIA